MENPMFSCGSKPETTAQKKIFLMKNTFAVTFTIWTLQMKESLSVVN